MDEIVKAKEAFKFYTRLNLSELTGLKAHNLKEFVDCLKQVPDSSVYQHTHRFLQLHQYISPEPPNDFAYWVRDALGESELAEELASIDTIQFTSIASLRNRIIEIVGKYIEKNPSSALKFTHRDKAFHFIKSVSFIIPTRYEARDIKEFEDALEKITADSLYYHIFEARLRLGRAENDFSNWFRNSLGNNRIADEIAKLDPYVYTLEDLRMIVARIISGGRKDSLWQRLKNIFR